MTRWSVTTRTTTAAGFTLVDHGQALTVSEDSSDGLVHGGVGRGAGLDSVVFECDEWVHRRGDGGP
ncbi:MAG: hypothetical protein U5R14_05915 [Gemmatimonadota bacterium]|nr:hypothetical protein [Gemmatimonadota bacterium]